MQAKLRCAIYTRVSTDNQAEVEFNSCEAQETKIRSFISSQECMKVFKVYSDPGFTGANLNRPALQEMLKDIEIASPLTSLMSRARNDGIRAVIVYKIDRLTRSPKDFYQLIELFDKYGVDFISVTEDLIHLHRLVDYCGILCLPLHSLKENLPANGQRIRC